MVARTAETSRAHGALRPNQENTAEHRRIATDDAISASRKLLEKRDAKDGTTQSSDPIGV
jgi:hypothetical protein